MPLCLRGESCSLPRTMRIKGDFLLWQSDDIDHSEFIIFRKSSVKPNNCSWAFDLNSIIIVRLFYATAN